LADPAPRTPRLAILFALVFPSLATWVYFVALAGRPAAVQSAGGAIGKVVQFGFPIAWTVLVLREKLPSLRPSARGVAAGLAFGVAVGAGMLGLALLWLEPNGFFAGPGDLIRAKVRGIGCATLGSYVALGAFYCVCHSWLEEYYWRWFVFGQLRRRMSLAAALLVSSLGFTAHHVLVLASFFGWASPATWVFSAGVAVGGACWAWLYERSGSLCGPWLSHVLVDAAIFVVGYELCRELFV
jgi:membrane protease YdiL (CAAX protease family)